VKLVEFYAMNIKPKKVRGTYKLNPATTAHITKRVSAMRQYDVNVWFYTKGDTTIAIDAGYKHYPRWGEKFDQLGIDPRGVEAVFLTHSDLDHCGGVDQNGNLIFGSAKVYIGEYEEIHLKNSAPRFSSGIIKVKNSTKLKEGYVPLRDKSVIQVGDIGIEVINVPGHTYGHVCYLVDQEILFTGDSIAMNKNGGYCLFDFFNVDSKMSMRSLNYLKEYVKDKDIKMVCTGHSGYTEDIESAFRHIDEVAYASPKKPFDLDAPYDVFEDE